MADLKLDPNYVSIEDAQKMSLELDPDYISLEDARSRFGMKSSKPEEDSIFDFDIPESVSQTGKALVSTMLQMPIGESEVLTGLGETGVATGLGIANFLMGATMKAPYSIFKGTQSLLGKETAVEEGEIGREGIQAAVDLMVPSFEPKTEIGQKMTKAVGQITEAIVAPGKFIKDTLTDRGYGNLGYLLGLGWELWTFKALHAAPGVARARLVRRSIRKASPGDLGRIASIVEGAGQKGLAKEIRRISEITDPKLKKEAVDKINNKALRFIADESRSALRREVEEVPIEELADLKGALQEGGRPEVADIIDYNELTKMGVGELGIKKAFPEAKITPLIKPKKPSIKEGQEHFRRTQAMTDRLNKMAQKARESGVVLSDKNKIDMRRAREEVQRAETLREDARQVPPRRRDVAERRKDKGREEIQRDKEERRAEVEEAPLRGQMEPGEMTREMFDAKYGGFPDYPFDVRGQRGQRTQIEFIKGVTSDAKTKIVIDEISSMMDKGVFSYEDAVRYYKAGGRFMKTPEDLPLVGKFSELERIPKRVSREGVAKEELAFRDTTAINNGVEYLGDLRNFHYFRDLETNRIFKSTSMGISPALRFIRAGGKAADVPTETMVVAIKAPDGTIFRGEKGDTHVAIVEKQGLIDKIDEGYVDGFADSKGRFYTTRELSERAGERPVVEDLPSYRTGAAATADDWVLNKRVFKSRQKAEEKMARLQKERGPELTAEEGLGEMEVVKIGKASYRVGVKEGRELEPQIEALARKEFGEESMPSSVLDTKGGRIAPDAPDSALVGLGIKLTPKEATMKVAEIGEKYLEIKDGRPRLKEGVDAKSGIDELDPLLGDVYSGDFNYNEIVRTAGEFMEILRRDGNLQKPNNVMRHPIEYKANSGSEIVLNDNLEAFKSPFKAANYAKENGIDGRPWKDPDLGWVIERGGRVAAEIQAHKEFKWYKGKKSYYDLLKKILKSQRGAIDIERLSTKQKESIRKSAMRSIKAGMDMEQYLIKQGIDPKGARDLKAAAVALDTKRTISEPFVTDFEAGPIVSTKARGKRRGMKVLGEVPIREGELNAIRKGPDLKSRGAIAEGYRVSVDAFDEAGSNVKRMFFDKYNENVYNITQKMREFMNESKSMRKTLPFRKVKEMGLYLIAEQEGGMQRLRNTKKYKGEKIIERLSDKQQVVADWTKGWFDKWFNEANEVRRSINKPEMKYEDAYFSFMQALTWSERLGVKTNLILDSPDTIGGRLTKWVDTPLRIARRRVKGEAVKKLNYTLDTDVFSVIESYASSVIDYIEMAPLVAKVTSIRRSLKQPGKDRRYILANEKPNLDSFLLWWSNHIAGRQLRSSSLEIPQLERALRALNKNLVYSTLSANARVAIIQPLAMKNANTLLGETNMVYGIGKSFTTSGWREAFRKSKIIDPRFYQQSIEHSFASTIGRRLGKAKRVAASAGFWPARILDTHAVIVTWHAALRDGRALVKNGSLHKSELYRYADDIVIRTQASGLKGHIAPIQRTALGRALTLFQTFVINDWNFFHRDVLGLKNPKVRGKLRLKRMLRYIGGTMILSHLLEDILRVKSPHGRPVKALMKGLEDDDSFLEVFSTVFRELLEPIPVFSSLRYGSHMLGALVDYLGQISKVLSRDPFKRPLYELIPRGLGAVGTSQALKIHRGVKRDAEVWEMIFGSVDRPTRGRRGGGLGGLKGLKGL